VLVGYVSDEYFAAIPDVLVEFSWPDGSAQARSSASGVVTADLQAGTYQVTLVKPGFSAKRTSLSVRPGHVHQFRLLSTSASGYAWPKWVRAGESSRLCINCAEPFSVGLWRHGLEAEHVQDIGYWDNHPPGAMQQILPDGDFTQTGARWGRHGYAFPSFDPRTTVVAPGRSGLYYFHLTGDWSNYTAPSGLPPTPSVNVRQEAFWFTDPDMEAWAGGSYPPLSFDRPEPLNRVFAGERIADPLRRLGAEHVAPAEWRLLGWLEREGFGYDLYAETQLHEGLLDLDRYRVLVLSTHPEYWTREMYNQIRDWVCERGGKLAYLGGNGINCEVEFLDATRMAVHNLDWGVRQAEFESRFHMRGESSARLLGTATTMAGYETGAPYRVLDAGHWAFEGTGLTAGDLFGSASLDRRAIGGASGHETDKLTASAPANVRLLAKGANPDDGGGEMVYFDTPSGGAVFSVGSISYTCSIFVDDIVSAVTRNVLRRFLQ
jgi:N,N-dimethylformamidase